MERAHRRVCIDRSTSRFGRYRNEAALRSRSRCRLRHMYPRVSRESDVFGVVGREIGAFRASGFVLAGNLDVNARYRSRLREARDPLEIQLRPTTASIITKS